MYALSTQELNTLAIIADPNAVETPCRTALEKLYRLDLVEPSNDCLKLSEKGKKALVKVK